MNCSASILKTGGSSACRWRSIRRSHWRRRRNAGDSRSTAHRFIGRSLTPTSASRDCWPGRGSITIGVFNFVGRKRQKSMERVIVENIFRRMTEHWKGKLPNKVRLTGKTLTLDFKNSSDQEAILDWLEDSKKTS